MTLLLAQHFLTYSESPQAPRAGSYRPPGVGFKRLSKVVGFSILLTEMFLISSGVRKPKSTLSMTDDTGWEIFMAGGGSGMFKQKRGYAVRSSAAHQSCLDVTELLSIPVRPATGLQRSVLHASQSQGTVRAAPVKVLRRGVGMAKKSVAAAISRKTLAVRRGKKKKKKKMGLAGRHRRCRKTSEESIQTNQKGQGMEPPDKRTKYLCCWCPGYCAQALLPICDLC